MMHSMKRQHPSTSSLQTYSSEESTEITVASSTPSSPLHFTSDVILASLPPSPPDLESPSSNNSGKDIVVQDYFHTNTKLLADISAASSPTLRIVGAVAGLLGTPFLLYRGLPAKTVAGNLQVAKISWDAFLRVSPWPLALVTLAVAVYYAPCCWNQCHRDHGNDKAGDNNDQWSHRLARWTGSSVASTRSFLRKTRSFFLTPDGLGLFMALALFIPISIVASLPMITPSWLWYPAALMDYKVYNTADLQSALEGLCLDQDIHDIRLPRRSSWGFPSLLGSTVATATMRAEERRHLPLCLTDDQWQVLSAGAITSTKAQDVRTVLKGVQFAKGEKSGLSIAILARDIVDNLPNLRENVEALRPFFPQLTVVIFENDSKDGSRAAIRQWVKETETSALGYNVDLMECAEAEDCQLGKLHRDTNKHGDYAKTSAVGDMDTFRQRVTDYITDSPRYADYSHMLVLDIDIAVSLSPFGVLHTLGAHPETAVASSGRQLWPGSLGTENTPYDYSAAVPWATEGNHYMLSLHERWCNVMPAGDRWRNACHAVSPFLQTEIFRWDRSIQAEVGDFYRVESAFNGAVLYPLELIRESQATYDGGFDGQRCEHIGFNLALKKPMYVNRRWDMHLDPSNPGGPTGWRAKNAIEHVSGTPRIILMVIAVQLTAYLIFMHSVTTLGVYLVYPLLAPLLVGGQNLRRMLSSYERKRRRLNGKGTPEDTLFKIV